MLCLDSRRFLLLLRLAHRLPSVPATWEAGSHSHSLSVSAASKGFCQLPLISVPASRFRRLPYPFLRLCCLPVEGPCQEGVGCSLPLACSGRLLVLCFVVLFPLVIFCVLTLPDEFTEFTHWAVRHYGHAEYNQANGRVWNMRVSEALNLKLYPDLVWFYGVM